MNIMDQQKKSFSTKTVLVLERNKPGMCKKHFLETFQDMNKNDWKISTMDENTFLYRCNNCNLERIYKVITTI
jgi:hypothetical protein